MGHNYFVTPAWLEANLDREQIRVVDATIFFDLDEEEMLRSGKEQFENLHIPGAIEANLLELSHPDNPLPFTVPEHGHFDTALEDMGIHADSHVIIYDSGPQVGVKHSASIWAARLAWQMLYSGFERVSILEGGLDRWIAEERPTSREIIKYPSGKLELTPKLGYLANKEDVLRAIEDPDTVIIDALSPEQFNGEVAPYGEEKAGHIPNSFNVFYGSLVDPKTGRLLSREQLSAKFEESRALSPDKQVIIYCGFGVGAAWVFMIMKYLGKDKVAIYDGSMDEWTQDNQCPIIRKEK